MSLFSFDLLYAKRVSEDKDTFSYICLMDQLPDEINPLIIIDKDVFEAAIKHENDLFGYVIGCLDQGSIEFDGFVFSMDIDPTSFPAPCFVAVRYILQSYIDNGEIPETILYASKSAQDMIKEDYPELFMLN